MTLDGSPANGCPGLYGKVPSVGDFVRRRLPAAFVDPWDDWLQAGVASSRKDLGDGWLATYLTSPIWRFALAARLCGPTPVLGVILPSVDAVNRPFPLTIAALVPPSTSLFGIAAGAERWFKAIETLALACLDRSLDLAELEARLDRIGAPAGESERDLPSAVPLPSRSATSLRWRLDGSEGAPLSALLGEALYPRLLDDLARSAFGDVSLWWTEGSDALPHAFLLYGGMPPAAAFSALLDDREPDRGTNGGQDPGETALSQAVRLPA